MLLNGISARKKDSRSTGQSHLGKTVGRPVARLAGKCAEHASTLTLLECRLDRSVARVALVLCAFEPRANDWPPLSKSADNFNAANWSQPERKLKMIDLSRGAECARPNSDYHRTGLDEGDTLMPRSHAQRTSARS